MRPCNILRGAVSKNVNPILELIEKQATPPTAPPLSTHAIRISAKSSLLVKKIFKIIDIPVLRREEYATDMGNSPSVFVGILPGPGVEDSRAI